MNSQTHSVALNITRTHTLSLAISLSLAASIHPQYLPPPPPLRLFLTHTHTRTLSCPRRLPMVKLNPSMLKVALRHFLNPCFFEVGSVMSAPGAPLQLLQSSSPRASLWCPSVLPRQAGRGTERDASPGSSPEEVLLEGIVTGSRPPPGCSWGW